MRKFKVMVSEHTSYTYIVEAESREQAEEMFADGPIDEDDNEILPHKTDVTDYFVALVLEE